VLEPGADRLFEAPEFRAPEIAEVVEALVERIPLSRALMEANRIASSTALTAAGTPMAR